MELLAPDAYKKKFIDADLDVIIEEKKKIETYLAEMEAEETFGTKPKASVLQQNAEALTLENQMAQKEEVGRTEIDPASLVKVTSAGENSKRSVYMTYQRILNELIKQKNEYMNEIEYKQKLRNMNADELMITRNRLVADINAYYKEVNQMRTKSMLLSIPFTRWLVKDKNVNENKDSLEVVMKKEEYVKYIEELQADPKHFEDLAEKQFNEQNGTTDTVEQPQQTVEPQNNEQNTQQ